ncbi:MAG: beta-ketoacyl synthase [Cellvibrionaceae bacterium]
MSKVRLPVVVGFGGYNAAGRSSAHHSYRRMVMESLPKNLADETVLSLSTLSGMVKKEGGEFVDSKGNTFSAAQVSSQFRSAVEDATLVRRVEKSYFDAEAVHWHKKLNLKSDGDDSFTFITTEKQLPEPLPHNWTVQEIVDGGVRVKIDDSFDVKIDSYRDFPVKSAGQMPSGFTPGDHYRSHFHPRGLQMAVLGASDAVHSMGIKWSTVVDQVRPDEIGVYAGSVLTQLDEFSNAGLTQSRLMGGRISSKQLAMGMNTMPADFVNAYVLGSVGVTGSIVGACATFLYTLRQGIEDIQSGRRRVVMVGGAESQINPEYMEGFDAMSALASDANLRRLDNSDTVDYRRASRPFGENCGFTMGESTQYMMLMDDELAMELGADIHAAVPNVYVNADGFKKSISAPGPGNYITFAKAVAAAQSIVGKESIQKRSVIQAHGSSTPQNRVSESLIFDRIAKNFGIENWPVAAVKSYLGHTIGPASADQLVATMGAFKHNILPGIKTIDRVADDVHDDHLLISNKDVDLTENPTDVAFLNSKGFGGNNATAAVLSPSITEAMLEKRYGKKAFATYTEKREAVRESAQQYDRQATDGDLNAIYKFGENMIDDSELTMDQKQLNVPGFKQSVSLEIENPFEDMR